MEKLAILGGLPVKTTPVPDWPQYDERERNGLMEVLDSRIWWRSPGTKALEFEQKFAEFHNAKYGIAVTNGTAALEVSIAALDIGPGDEVIVPDFTFIATASAVLFSGALPVLVDIDPETYCIDPRAAEAAITDRTKAVIAVHMGGNPANLDALVDLCKRHKLHLIEDSSHAHGSEWKGRKVGSYGSVGTFSFQSGKLMTAGEGGIILTNDPEIERLARSIHDCGRMPGEWFYSHYIYGSNYRLSEWQAVVLSAQLARFPEQNSIRSRNAAVLNRILPKIEGITPQKEEPQTSCNGHYAYIFHYDPQAFQNLPIGKFREALEQEGFPTHDSYPPLHDLDIFTSGEYRKRLPREQAVEEHSFLSQAFPHTDKAAWETVWLPQPVLLCSEEDMYLLGEAIQKIQAQAGELV